MENKETSELLDLLWKMDQSTDETVSDWDAHWKTYGEVRAELEKRPPFNEIIGEREERNEYSHEERLEDLENEIKLLKRHKHDTNSGDVMVRI